MYPLAKQFTIAGMASGALAVVVFGSLIAGLAFFVLFVSAGLVWRANEPPILSFTLAFQWIFIVVGYLYTAAGGNLGEYTLIGNVDLAVLASLVGLLCIAIGMRLGLATVRKRIPGGNMLNIEIGTLFWATVITYSISWVVEISPTSSSNMTVFNAAQILYSILSFREVLFCLLWFVILQRREGYRYGWIALLVALLPRFVSRQSTFKELIFMLLVVALAEYKPWVKTAFQRAWNRRLMVAYGTAAVLLFIAGVIWEGAIKPVWRNLEFDSTSQLETLDIFAHVAATTTSEMQEESGIQALIERVSSITQFALVLDRVPLTIPFENGRLTKRALVHILVPRLLFPNKENLGPDSWLAEQYAGLDVGEDTSVGIGYMAEFYVDWGIGGMICCLFVLGLFFGIIYRLIFVLSPNSIIASALVIVPFMGNFITFEATLPKLLGGFIMTTVVLLILARLIPFLLHPRFVRQAKPLARSHDFQSTKRFPAN